MSLEARDLSRLIPVARHSSGLAFAGFAVLTTVFLWPLAWRPGQLAVANPDVYGNAWTLAWLAHQLASDPLRLAEANMFFPETGALGYTEPLVAEGLQAAPLLWSGASPILAHNLLALLTFPLSALGMYLLIRDMAGSRLAGLLAGSAYAFASYRFGHVVHLQSLSYQWLPFAVLYLRRAVGPSGRRRDVIVGCVFAALQALSSGYYAIVLAVVLGLWLAFAAAGAPRKRIGAVALGLLVAAGVSALAALPNQGALRRESEQRGYKVRRSPEEQTGWSADWRSYVDPGPARTARLAGVLGLSPSRESLYVGAIPLCLAAFAVASPGVRRLRDGNWAIVTAAVGVVLSLGPVITVFGWSFHGPLSYIGHLPGLSSLRTPSRFGVITLFALSILAGLGLAMLRRGKVGRLGGTALVVITLVELSPKGFDFRPLPPPPPTVAWLAAAPRGVVLELPWDHETLDSGAQYLLWSTGHWQRLVNGWGGIYPERPLGLALRGRQFPGPAAARDLRESGIRYVVVHLEAIPAHRVAQRERLVLPQSELPPGVRLAADFGSHRIYDLNP